MSEPPTPIHVAPNEEVAELPAGVMQDISLNPDLEASDSDGGAEDVEPTSGGFVADHTSLDDDEASLDADAMAAAQAALTPAFDAAYAAVRAEFNHKPLSSQQLSNLIGYVDGRLLQIQRAYVKSQAGEHAYPLRQLIGDLDKVSQVVWLSISAQTATTVEYYIKMLSDFEDYVDHYQLGGGDTEPVLRFCQALDTKLSVLFDSQLLTKTQFVRAVPIMSRLRVGILRKIVFPADSGVSDIETTKLFEGMLDRSSS